MKISPQPPRSHRSSNFGAGVTNELGEAIRYAGPEDGRSHPNLLAQKLVKPLVAGLVATAYRVEVEGIENFPQEGAHVYAPTHPSIFDPPVVAGIVKRDMRYMADIGLFKNSVGAKLLTWGGGFPVDRTNPSPTTIKHAVEVVQEGHGLCIFPEGGIPATHKHGQINSFKKGAAFAAIQGGAETVVPIAIDYQPDTKPRKLEKLVALASSTALAVSTALAGHLDGWCRWAPALSGAVSGAYLLGKKLRSQAKHKWYNIAPKVLAGLGGGAVGGALGATVATLATGLVNGPAGFALGVALGGSGGFFGYKLAEAFIHRDVARVKVGEPIPVAPYRDDPKGVDHLTEEMHRRIGHLKADLTGVPYDDKAPKFLRGFLEHK